MNFIDNIQLEVANALLVHFDCNVDAESVLINTTKAVFEGDFTVVLFPFIKKAKVSPDKLGETLGQHLLEHSDSVSDFNIVKGFLNLSLSNDFWINKLIAISKDENYGDLAKKSEKVLVEYSSPNTNKPLHMGHIRNILLGWSMSQILEKAGYDVVKTMIVNDRGIAICKSMLAWQKFGNGETPESAGLKSDFLVGKYYVEFDKQLKSEYNNWQSTSDAIDIYKQHKSEDQEESDFFSKFKNKYFNEHSVLGKEAKDMLIKWEEDDKDVKDLWHKMNQWVYQGHDVTYENLRVNFDKIYYESSTYITGKEVVLEGMKDGTFYENEDKSIWVDLEDVGLDKKIILRSDGTSVYLTQDLGTADIRYNELNTEKMIYVVGDEQDYHFRVLFEIMKKLKRPYSTGLYHLSYGMIDLPTGKMKSREGTVVDADVLVAEVIQEARDGAKERGDAAQLSEDEQNEIFNRIGLGALKFFILKVGPKKRMVFNPQESVDMQGQTGPYIQNAFVRIKSIFRKGNEFELQDFSSYEIEPVEKDLLKTIVQFPVIIENAASQYDPSLVANYSYTLAKQFHKFYHDIRILGAESETAKSFRLQLCKTVADVLESSLQLLGIEMPDRM